MTVASAWLTQFGYRDDLKKGTYIFDDAIIFTRSTNVA